MHFNRYYEIPTVAPGQLGGLYQKKKANSGFAEPMNIALYVSIATKHSS